MGEQQNQQVKQVVSQWVGNVLDNQTNFKKLATNSDGTTRDIDDIQEVVLSGISQQTGSGGVTGGPLSSAVIEQTWLELRPWIEACLRDLNRNPLDHCREVARSDIERWIRRSLNQSDNRKLEECLRVIQEVKSIQELLDKYIEIRNNELLNKIDKKDELIKIKGYSERDVQLLREWELTEQSSDFFPNLYDERRIGVTNLMYTCGGENGGTNEVIIFLRPKKDNSEVSVNFSCKWGKWEEGYKKIIRNFLKEQNSSADVYVLMRLVERGGGDSAGIGHYLALWSAFHRTPLPRNLGSTGTVEEEKIGKIGGLRWKLKGAVNKKNVKNQPDKVDVFILSEENKKDKEYEIQSYEDTPDSIKKEIKQVHFAGQKNELERHLKEVLAEPKSEKECSEDKEEKPIPKPKEPERRRGPPINSEITSEQILSLITELSIRENKDKNQDFWEKLQTAYARTPDYQQAVAKILGLREEYLGKLEKMQSDPNHRNPSQSKKVRKFTACSDGKKLKEEEVEEDNKMICEVCRQQFEDGYSVFACSKPWWCSKCAPDKVKKAEAEVKEEKIGGKEPTQPNPEQIEQKRKQLYQEYENKFQQIASSVANLTTEILTNLQKFGYTIQEIKWISELKAPSLTVEPSVRFSLAGKK